MKASLFISHIESSIPHLLKYINEEYLPKLNLCLDNLKVEIGERDEVSLEPYTIVVIASGGPTSDFYKVYEKVHGPYVLLTTQFDNSIGCALEIKTYLNNRGESSEILYGNIEDVAKRLNEINRAIMAKKRISEMRFGLIGSQLEETEAFSTSAFEKTFNTKPSCVSMAEFVSEIEKAEYEPTEQTRMLLEKAPDKQEMLRALHVYGALKRIIARNGYNAVAVRCFELLEYKVTSCVALALLNQEGIYAACEGDMRSLVSMVILGEVSGQHVFMANPSQAIKPSQNIVFAHCTLPLDMVNSFDFTDHFESGYSIAFCGHFESDVYTVFKCKEDLSRFSVKRGEWVSSPKNPLLCRTQIELHFDEIESFFTNPINNHQLICHGDYVQVIKDFFEFN